jgi:hypothetical protein
VETAAGASAGLAQVPLSACAGHGRRIFDAGPGDEIIGRPDQPSTHVSMEDERPGVDVTRRRDSPSKQDAW